MAGGPRFLTVLALTLTLAGAAGEGPLRALVPADGAVRGWARDGVPQEYEGEDLYIYIDGGAEIYREFGFRRVLVQDFRGEAGGSISLEIFEMAGPEAAFGMFTFKRSGRGRALDLGGGAELESYYLNFWKGRYLVTLTGFDGTAATLDGLAAVAGAVDAAIRETGAPPGLVAGLPADGLVAGSVRYVRGLLGLNAVYAFGTARGLDFAAGVRGAYADGTELVLLEYGSAEAAAAAGRELGRHLEGSERFAREEGGESGVLLVRDSKGRRLALAAAGPRLVVGLGPDAEASLGAVRRAR
mgnify:FL=1